jgi:hypothetical protein
MAGHPHRDRHLEGSCTHPLSSKRRYQNNRWYLAHPHICTGRRYTDLDRTLRCSKILTASLRTVEVESSYPRYRREHQLHPLPLRWHPLRLPQRARRRQQLSLPYQWRHLPLPRFLPSRPIAFHRRRRRLRHPIPVVPPGLSDRTGWSSALLRAQRRLPLRPGIACQNPNAEPPTCMSAVHRPLKRHPGPLTVYPEKNRPSSNDPRWSYSPHRATA